jgi:hypothetical protein
MSGDAKVGIEREPELRPILVVAKNTWKCCNRVHYKLQFPCMHADSVLANVRHTAVIGPHQVI